MGSDIRLQAAIGKVAENGESRTPTDQIWIGIAYKRRKTETPESDWGSNIEI